MSITANHGEGGRPRGQPPTAVQCALALVTAGLAVAAAMLALIGTAQATYVVALADEGTQPQSATPIASSVQAAPTSTPPAAKSVCSSVLPATYDGTIRLNGEPAADPLTLTASIDGQTWATATVSDGRYSIDVPQKPPKTPPCFPDSGTILFTLEGYTCLPAEQEEGTGWVACGYRSFTPGLHHVDLVCLPMPTPTPLPDDATGAAALVVAGVDLPLNSTTTATYYQLSQAEPDSTSPARAAFLRGLVPYLDGDAAAAKEAWEDMLDAFPGAEQRAQAHLWLAKLDMTLLNDPDGASSHLQQALAAADGFYALRAEALLENQGAAPLAEGADTMPTPAADWEAVEGWLTSIWGPEALAPGPSPFDLTAWQRGQEFYQLGLAPEATNEFFSLIDQCSLQPWSVYRLARAFHDLDLPNLSAGAAGRLLALAGGPLEQMPRPLLELAYPLAYPSLIQAAAAENGLSPLLLLAMIRQESFFNPLAVSPAGALGLTQVMPSTADGISANLGLQDFSTSDLLQPQVSIEFGAYYLGRQLRQFDGNLYFALAAYNAGSDNAARWRQSLPTSDMDLFVELIDFTETRSYVKLVLENYAVYRFLYGGPDHATLLSNPPQ
jgi:soluble lytic murein transglycosylase-like protein